MTMRKIGLVATVALGACTAQMGTEAPPPAASPSQSSAGLYRLPYADGTRVKIFDDFRTHRPVGRIDLFAVGGAGNYRVVAAAAGTIAAIQDGFSEQQSGRAARIATTIMSGSNIATANGRTIRTSPTERSPVPPDCASATG